MVYNSKDLSKIPGQTDLELVKIFTPARVTEHDRVRLKVREQFGLRYGARTRSKLLRNGQHFFSKSSVKLTSVSKRKERKSASMRVCV
jgi:hypothetical protein